MLFGRLLNVLGNNDFIIIQVETIPLIYICELNKYPFIYGGVEMD